MSTKAPLRLNFLLRDANQSLIAGRERTDRNLQKTDMAVKAGFSGIEIWGGTQLEAPARFKGEHPFNQGLKPLSEAAQNIDRMMLMRGQAGNGRRIYSDEAIKLEMDVITRDDQITTIRAFDATNNFDNLQTVFETKKDLQAQGRNVKLQAAMAYALSEKAEGDPEGWTYRDPQFFVDLADRYIAAGADEICFKDMAGVMKPEDAAFMVKTIKARHPDVPLTLHMHASSGQAQATLLAAIKAGIDTVDVGVDGMSDWVGHVSAQDLLWLMKNSDDPEILARLPQMDEQVLEQLAEHNYESRMLHRAFELSYDPEIQQAIVQAGLPGGMATTLLNNVSELYRGQADRQELKTAMLESLKLIPGITADLGHLEKVTPTSDIVGKQAVYNWFYGQKGAAPYSVLGPGFADYVLGYNGYSQNKPKEQIISMIEQKTGKPRYDGRAADRMDPNEVENTHTKLEELGLETSDENVLVALMSGDDGAGYNFLLHQAGKQPLKKYEPEAAPGPAPYYAFKLPIEKEGFLSPQQETNILGMLPERLVQRALKLQMIEDGASFAGIDPELKQHYVDELKADIEADLKAVPGKLKEAGYTDLQILTRMFNDANGNNINQYIHQRAEQMGLRKGYLPIVGENLSYRPSETPKPGSALTAEGMELAA